MKSTFRISASKIAFNWAAKIYKTIRKRDLWFLNNKSNITRTLLQTEEKVAVHSRNCKKTCRFIKICWNCNKCRCRSMLATSRTVTCWGLHMVWLLLIKDQIRWTWYWAHIRRTATCRTPISTILPWEVSKVKTAEAHKVDTPTEESNWAYSKRVQTWARFKIHMLTSICTSNIRASTRQAVRVDILFRSASEEWIKSSASTNSIQN